jgi:prevent-host-death family protein
MAKEVGIRQLKNEASALVERVEQGEILTVTRHGKPVARIVPVGMPPGLARLVGDGRVTWSGGKPALPTRVAAGGKGRTAAETVIEDRGPR